jgi:DHA1 family bicyclomycin/chloramphenicol resistance-like MFS transporter
MSTLMAAAALSIDLMLPAFGRIREEFGVPEDSTRVGAVLTSFFLGMALAQIVYGPFADRFGRKPTLYVGLAIYVVAALASAVAPSLELVIVSRFIWGIGAAAPRVVSLSIVRDSFEGTAMARAMSFIMAVFLLIPIFMPAIGAAVLEFANWRWLFVIAAGFGVLVALWTIRLPETLDPANRIALSPSGIYAAGKVVVTNRVTMGYTVARMFAFGAMLSYLATSELIISSVYGRPDLFPVVFGITAAFIAVAILANAKLVGLFSMESIVRAAFATFIGMAAVLSLLAWATDGVPSFWLFMFLLAVALGSYGLIIPNLNTLAMEPMAAIAGTAAAITGTIGATGGAVLGFALDQTFDGTVLPLSLGLLAYGIVAFGFSSWARRAIVPTTEMEPATT